MTAKTTTEPKKIIILGAGVVGLTSAYALVQEGYNVHVVDTAPEPATGASRSNGFQLSYGYLAPPFTFWEAVQRFKNLVQGTDPKTAVAHIKRGELLRNWPWFARALWQTLPFNYRRNFRDILKLGQLSQFTLQAFLSGDGKDFDFNFSTQGKLVVEAQKSKLTDDFYRAQYITAETGWPAEKFGRKKCYEAVPFLEHSGVEIAGGVYSENNYAGNCVAFCQQLAKLLEEKFGVTFTFNAPHASLDHYTAEADAVVVACGISAKSMLKTKGIRAPIYPVKGYSFDFERIAPQHVYLTYKPKGFVISDMGTSTRVSGFADFVGFETSDDATRQQALLNNVQSLFPNQKLKIVGEYMAFRPMTPHGLPIVKQTRHKKIFVNIGHGMYGWTLAHGTAHKLAELIKKRV